MTKKDEQIIKSFAEYMRYNLKSSENTIKSYASTLNQLFATNPDYTKLTKQDIIKLIGQMNQKYKPSTVTQKITAIQEFYKYLVTTEQVKENIALGVPRPKLENKEVIPPTREQVENTIKKLQCEGHDMLALATRLGCFIGLRISEARKLEIQNINFKEGYAILNATKGATMETVSLDKGTLEMIESYCKKHGVTKGRILRNKSLQPVSESALFKDVKKYCPNNFHLNRHFCGSELANVAGIFAVKSQLRHKSIKTSERYSHIQRDKQTQTLNQLWG